MDHFLRPGLRFDVIDSGPADAPAVVLLHGFPQQPSSFEAVASRLNAEGLRTLTPTQRGYTAAARPATFPGACAAGVGCPPDIREILTGQRSAG